MFHVKHFSAPTPSEVFRGAPYPSGTEPMKFHVKHFTAFAQKTVIDFARAFTYSDPLQEN